MKIFVAGDQSENKKKSSLFSTGIRYLESLGHNVTSKNDFKGNESAQFAQVQKAIKNIDIFIIEITVTDVKSGFEVAKALDEKKMVIALYKKITNKENLNFFTNQKSRNLIMVEYSDDDLKEKIDKALSKAKKLMDSKFILIISPEIDRYLDWASTNKRMHKAQIVRNALESAIKKDKGYKSYLEE